MLKGETIVASGDTPHQPAMKRILVVEDDIALGLETARFMADRGYAVDFADDAVSARRIFEATPIDLFILDIVMPGTSGKVLCREIVESSRAGVIIVSSLEADEDRISLLEMGADDYLVKPFNPLELLARVRAFFRRQDSTVPVSRVTQIGDWTFEGGDRRIRHRDGKVVTLTPSEAQVLRYLTANPGIVFDREEILAVSRVRQHAGANDRSVDNLIKRLRQKIEPDPGSPVHIETVWGKGYTFRAK